MADDEFGSGSAAGLRDDIALTGTRSSFDQERQLMLDGKADGGC
ncbi:MAG: hypothetical protein PHO72_04865 [Sphaerochaeta sp.]|nr:hypothetical protein [Sphaerochaeta sp.]